VRRGKLCESACPRQAFSAMSKAGACHSVALLMCIYLGQAPGLTTAGKACEVQNPLAYFCLHAQRQSLQTQKFFQRRRKKSFMRLLLVRSDYPGRIRDRSSSRRWNPLPPSCYYASVTSGPNLHDAARFQPGEENIAI
jgi:hypothetical protein